MTKMLIQAWILFSLAVLSATSPIYPELVLSSYSQPTEEDIFFPFDPLDGWRSLPPREKLRTELTVQTKDPPRPLNAPEVTPVYIAPNDPVFMAVYASLNPLEYATDLQEQREMLRKAQEGERRTVGDQGLDYDDEDNWKAGIHRQRVPSF